MYCLYAVPMMMMLLAVVDCSENKTTFDVQTSLANKVCPVDRQLFATNVVSLISCVMVAFMTADCVGVSYNQEQHMCYGCDTSTDVSGEFKPLPGTVFYSRPKAPPGFQDISGYMLKVVEGQDWTYDEAENACAEYSASLVRIDSTEKKEKIRDYLNTLKVPRFWIQCRKDTRDGAFKFDDDTPVTSFNSFWEPGEPDTTSGVDCGFMFRGSSYNTRNRPCANLHGYICEV